MKHIVGIVRSRNIGEADVLDASFRRARQARLFPFMGRFISLAAERLWNCILAADRPLLHARRLSPFSRP